MFLIFRVALVIAHFISGLAWAVGELIENVGLIVRGKQTHFVYGIVWEKSALKWRTWLSDKSELK